MTAMDSDGANALVTSFQHLRIAATSVSQDDLVQRINRITLCFRNQLDRNAVSEEECHFFNEAFVAAKRISNPSLQLDLTTELFRCLRNACAYCQHNQDVIGRNGELFSNAVTFFGETLNIISEATSVDESLAAKRLMCLRCGVQFWGNLVVGNEFNKTRVWQEMKKHFRYLISQDEDATLAKYSCMVLYNCLVDMPRNVQDLLGCVDDRVAICQAVVALALQHDCEWGLYALETVLQDDRFAEVFCGLPDESRLFVLDLITSTLTTKASDSSQRLPVGMGNIACVAKEFVSHSDNILRVMQDKLVDMKPTEFVKLLGLLCSASALEVYRIPLQMDSNLLIVSLFLLKAVHLAGRTTENNCFTPVEKLSEIVNPEDELIYNHPAYGMKRDLVRLVGNLCWNHRNNQDKIREIDGIPLLLDCCKIDARNPYIIQWVVFAIHNICEGNLENQDVIARMQRVNVPDDGVSRHLFETIPERGASSDSGANSSGTSKQVHSENNTSKENSTTLSRAIEDIEELFM